MKHSFKCFAVIIILVSAGRMSAQNSASTSVNEAATISQPIQIFKNTDLNFGSIIAGLVGGNVHVTGTIGALTTASNPPTGVTTTSESFPGGSGPSPYSGGSSSSGAGFSLKVSAQVASFIVTGEPCLTYSIAVSGGTSVSDNTFPGHTMAVVLDKPIGGNVNGSGTGGTIQNNGDPGTDKFVIGGTLTVGPFQTSGLYTGSFSVQVCYN